MGNIYLMCIKKNVDIYQILRELSSIMQASLFDDAKSGETGWDRHRTVSVDWITEYFALSLNCNGKAFFQGKEVTLEKYEQKMRSFDPICDVEGGPYCLLDENENITEVEFQIRADFFEDTVDFDVDDHAKNESVPSFMHYVYGNSKLFLSKSTEPNERYTLSMLFMNYRQMEFDKRKRDIDRVEISFSSLDNSCGNTFTLVEAKGGVLKEIFEKVMDYGWTEESMIQRTSYENPEMERWVDKLMSATGRKFVGMKWRKSEYLGDSYPIEYVEYYSTYGRDDVVVRVNISDVSWSDKEFLYIRNREGLSQCFGRRIAKPSYYRKEETENSFVPTSSSKIRALVEVIEKSITEYVNDRSIIEEKKEVKLKFSDAIVTSSVRACYKRSHTVVPKTGLIELLTAAGEIIEYQVYLGYCQQCKVYTMYYSDYYKMLEKGKPLCKVYYLEDESKWPEISRFDYRSQSTLAAMGYSVSQTSDLSEEERREILDKAIQKNTVQVHDLLDFLNWLVRTRETQDKYKRAVKRWNDDIVYVKETYGENGEKVRVASITVKKRGTDA